ncbi:MAG: DUF937 domain-containing protein [Lachnospiraceae bacterium]|nr:DUF937 domain-containing protein [Lachnospiraceae bacterium]
MDLLNMLMSTMNSSSARSALAGKTGASTDQISSLIQSALPALLSGMTKNASSPDGAQSLFKALGQHTSTKSMADQITDADEADGAKIIGHILGGSQKDVVGALAKESKMEESQVTKALGSMAPALLSGLSAATNNAGQKDDKGGFDLSSLMGMFGGGDDSDSIASSGGGIGSLLGSLFGGGKDDKEEDASGNALLSTLTSLLK